MIAYIVNKKKKCFVMGGVHSKQLVLNFGNGIITYYVLNKTYFRLGNVQISDDAFLGPPDPLSPFCCLIGVF